MPEATAAPPIDPRAIRALDNSCITGCQDTPLGKYGMTVSQVAEVFGVPAGEIERVLHQAGRG